MFFFFFTPFQVTHTHTISMPVYILSRLSFFFPGYPAVAYKAFADLPIADRSRSWSVERMLGEVRVPPRVLNALTHYIAYISRAVYIYL